MLVGKERNIKKFLTKTDYVGDRISIKHAAEVIKMNDPAAVSVRRKMVKRCRSCCTNCYFQPPAFEAFIPDRVKNFIKEKHIFLLKATEGRGKIYEKI